MANDKTGIRDVPISGQAEDTLGLKDYATALGEFALTCETPMTIGVAPEIHVPV